jgi:excisionase family DNA binding protein
MHSSTSTSTGNMGLDALADAIADRVIAKLQTSKETQRLMTAPEAAEYIGRTERAVRHMIASKALPVVRKGRSVRLDRKDLDTWIELHRFTS